MFDLGASTFGWRNIYVQNGLISTSDRRKKKDIIDATKGLDFLKKLRPVEYRLKDGDSNRVHYGLIAQEVESVMRDDYGDTTGLGNACVIKSPRLVPDETFDATPDAMGRTPRVPLVSSATEFDFGLRYEELISPLIKAVQELEERVATLEP